ncbi:glycosyltransferase family 2 protein [Euzebya tangerina]|uniref:glycosyltransferase family 2 protein n=1 Tax=Euzebya tangerina TaxID=591198 RepID=UPI000E323C62|nr:glycosyltransferase family A protein [Euzebya tangerina]
MPPVLSIGLPVYNGENYLESSAMSLLEQTFTDFELIIVDNASTDRTEEICRSLARRDDRVSYHRNERNIGASRNYNRAFELARGEFFKWAAHDDECHPRMLEACLQAFQESDDDVVMVYPLGELIDDRGLSVRSPLDRIASDDPRPAKRIQKLLRSLSMCDPVFGVYRTDALRQSGLIGSFCGADYVLMAEMAMMGKIREVEEPLFRLRKHAQRSNTANTSTRDRTAWYNPDAVRAALVLPIWEQMVWGLLKAITRSELAVAQKGQVTAAALAAHYSRRLRVFGGRKKRELRALITHRAQLRTN